MKKLFILTMATVILACDPEPELISTGNGTDNSPHKGAFILSEGLFNLNNSTLAWIDFNTCKPDSWDSGVGTSYDVFEKVNGRRLGDTANDFLLYGSRLYIAVNVSSTIEILDAATCRSLSQIKMENNGVASQPRYLAAHDGYVYVCCFDGTVSKIDTVSMTVSATVTAGRNPDGICCTAGKLYVSNSGGLDFSNPDNTVSVIDLESFTEKTRIQLRDNPGIIRTDSKSIFVVTRGIFDYDRMDYDYRLHRIDTSTDCLTETYDIPVLNMDIHDGKAWFYRYGSGTIQVMDIETGQILNPDFIADGTHIKCPYSIKVDPATEKVYICDAADYITPGTLYCFSPQGRMEYMIPGVGINPNGIQFCDIEVKAVPYSGQDETVAELNRVFEYMPAPGQFINTLPCYDEGDDAVTMAGKCLSALQNGGMITLGGFGGYITVGFSASIRNLEGVDFRIDGNALINGAEPAVVWVSTDANCNGLPDDEWFEIPGSEHKNGRAVHNYTIRYRKPVSDDADSPWTGSDGRTGSIIRNIYHKQPYYPQWYKCDSVEFTATLLPDNMSYQNGLWVMPAFEYGYVDNLPNSDTNSSFDIAWAVKPDGSPAGLESIDFIKIQNGVLGCNDLTGEQSTEITSIINLNPKE
ncbi:MAG: YncE family protein [Bacteroidaceae bacterium]